MPNLALAKQAMSSLASTSVRASASAGASGGAEGGGVGLLGELNEEQRTRHSIRSIDSGLGESDDPTQVDKDNGVEASC